MFQKFKTKGSFGGRSRNSRFGKPSRNGSTGNAGSSFRGRNRPQRRMKTLVVNDPGIFIKKATPNQVFNEKVKNTSFNEFNIPQILKQNIAQKGYTTPTPIQDQGIEPMLEGRDLIGIANTGTGKTAAFLIPIINKIFQDKSQKALIVAPTRELAAQINEEFKSFTKNMNLYSTLIIGGANMRRQTAEIGRNPHVVIGTPGRLKDLIQRRSLYLGNYSTIVLDEVDLMVDIGFINDVKYFISLLPKVRQSLFFSATVNSKVGPILESFVTNPVTVSVKRQDTAENIEQNIVKIISNEKKVDQLHELLVKEGFDKVLIFGRTKHGIERLHRELIARGFKAGAIHGNKSQGYRQRVLKEFKESQIKILLATDVASRGLDIPNVSHVINYELPESYADYIHRIGRTGRANKTGTALTFIP